MFRVTIKLCIALLLLTVIADAQDKSFDLPLDNLSRSFSPPVSEVKISNAVVASIRNGDFVHPTFSPDGKVLAYSKVLLQGDFENTEVLLYDLNTSKQSVLLDSRRAEQYATYKAFVTGMTWRSAKRLEVLVSDGDVDSTRLIFDPYSRKLLRRRAEGLDEIEVQPMSLIYQKAYQQAQSLFPSFPPDVLNSALRDTAALVIPDQGIVLQKNYAGHDDNVWFLDFQNKSVTPLIKLSADSARTFSGGVSFKSSIIMLLSRGPKAYLFLYRDGKIKPLAALNSKGFSRIEVKHVSSSKVVFLIRTHADYERGDNPLLVFDGERLLRIKEYAELYDAGVDARGRRIAYCYWVGDKRHIVVKEMN